MIYSRTDTGLLVAENAAGDERAVARILKEYDRDLRLVPQGMVEGRTLYKVYRYAGGDRPAQFICAWCNDRGEPYPLSSRLLDKVRELDRNSSATYLSEDERNARLRTARDKHALEQEQALVEDWASREGVSACLPRGIHLRRARARTSYHEKEG